MLKQWLIALGLLLLAGGGVLVWDQMNPEVAIESQRERPASKVNVVSPVLDLVTDSVSAVGSLRALNQVGLTTEVSGRVVATNLQAGSRVVKGDLLLRLDDSQARADLQVAEATLADARRQLDRAQSLQANNSISRSQVDGLRTATEVAEAQLAAVQTRVDNHRILAPFEGVIGLNDINVGAYLSEGTQVTTLDSTARMQLSFAISEKFVGQIRLGQPVQGQTPAYANEIFTGELTELGTRINELSRTLPVRAQIDNADGRLRPGQFMSARLTLRQREAMTVPEQAVMLRGDETFVFVAVDGVAKRISVALGSRSPGVVEVASGLALADRVIVTGQDRLSSGDRIEVVEDTGAIPDNRFADTQGS